MNKLLVICGPTATGKTKLGIHLAKKYKGVIISADSRQVYKGMDIGTGKEWGDVPIFGYDLVDPKEDFSISQYLKYSQDIISQVEKEGKLPIIVGGTGFYIKGIVDGIPTLEVPRNENLRKNLETKTAEELFENLSQINPIRAGSMNASDKKNPRRLIRAIEIAQYQLDHKLPPVKSLSTQDVLFIGLTADKKSRGKRIKNRVNERVKRGIKEEIQNLLNKGVNWNDQSMYSLGYRQYRDYYEGEVPEKNVIDEWQKEEIKYAKRQMVWFKKDPRINWFDVEDANFAENVEKLVTKWYLS